MTASNFTGSKPQRLPIDVLEVVDRSTDRSMSRSSPSRTAQQGLSQGPGGDFDLATASIGKDNESGAATSKTPTSWYWGASGRPDAEELDEEEEEGDEEDGKDDGDRDGTFLGTERPEERADGDAYKEQEGDATAGVASEKLGGTGIFWRGNNGAALLFEEKVKKKEQAARAEALKLANLPGAPEPTTPDASGALDDLSLGNDSGISGTTATDFTAVEGRVSRLGEPDKDHPKDVTFGEFRGWWSKYVTHLFENGSSSGSGGGGGGHRALRLRHGDDDEDGLHDKVMHERLLGLLQDETKRFLKPKEIRLVVEELRALKARITECYRHEKKMAGRLEALAVEIEQRKSKATIAVAEVQFKVANEHVKLLAVEGQLGEVIIVADEFTHRTEASLEEEATLVKRLNLLNRRIAKADARLATALAVEARVHRECGQQLHEQKVTSMVCRQDTLLAMRRHEDAVYALHLRIRNAAATRIQNLYRSGRAWDSYISRLDALEAALGDFDEKAGREEDRLISQAAAHLQGFCRIMQARDRVFAEVKQEYQKRYDKITGSYYYFITRTKRSVWHKPKVNET